MKFINLIKKYLKKKRFIKLSESGKNLSIGINSNCIADKPGNITIGDNCEILGTLLSMDNGRIEIGNYSEIREGSFIGSVEHIKIGDYVIISNNIRIFDNNNHPTDPDKRKEMCKNGFYGDAWRWKHSEHQPVVIEDNVWIGERSTILKGVTIGKGSVIGCCSVVTKDIPPYSVAAGNPARVVKKIEH